MKLNLRFVGVITSVVGCALFAYVLYQAYLAPKYPDNTTSIDLIAIASTFLICSGFWLFVRKKHKVLETNL